MRNFELARYLAALDDGFGDAGDRGVRDAPERRSYHPTVPATYRVIELARP